MYEYFTDRLRRAVKVANQHARKWEHLHLGTEHLLLGLIDDQAGLAAHIMRDVTPLATVKNAVESAMVKGEPCVTTGQNPMTPRAKKSIELAKKAAQELGDKYINTEHLLLGLVRQEDGGIAKEVLSQHGITIDTVERITTDLIGKVLANDKAAADTVENHRVVALLMRCRDSISSMDEDDDLEMSIQGVEQAIRWLVDHRIRLQAKSC